MELRLDDYNGSSKAINVQSHITSEELFQHIHSLYNISDLEQWNEDSSTCVPIYSAEDIEPADGAKFTIWQVSMCTVSVSLPDLGKRAQWHRMLK